MDETKVQELLIERAKLLAAVAEKDKYRNDLRKQILSKVQDELDALDKEFDTSALTEQANALQKQITDAVLKLAHTVKVESVGQAIYNSGRVTWETEKLDGLIKAVPVLKDFRKVGKPYITFR